MKHWLVPVAGFLLALDFDPLIPCSLQGFPDLIFTRDESLDITTNQEIDCRVQGQGFSIFFQHFGGVSTKDGQNFVYRLQRDLDGPFFLHFMIPQVLSCVLARQGREPLHGTSLAFNGRSIGLLGVSGMGKTTLSQFLLENEWKLISDDMIVPSRDEPPLLEPGLPRLKVLRDNVCDSCGVLMDFQREKSVVFPPAEKIVTQRLPLASLVILERGNQNAPILKRVSGTAGFPLLLAQVYNTCYHGEGRKAVQMKELVRLMDQVPLFKLTLPPRERFSNGLLKVMETLVS